MKTKQTEATTKNTGRQIDREREESVREREIGTQTKSIINQ